ncbi:MAG: ATP-dependent RecD-like DNA helicase [Clostridia bacterium]|nr:ATP-dependent RecD-like DNA helicase [Clostridia bacterium]
MILSGEIEDIIFHNGENGFTILSLFTEDGPITATGKFPVLGVGERVEMEGDFKINPKYGEQFVATSVKISKPTSISSIKNYLASGLISGVGDVTATNIVNMFGDKTLEIIEFYPSELAKVKGISLKKASDIALSYKEIKKMQDAVMFLQQYDISINMAVKIYNKYKNATQKVLSDNPYTLIEDIDGIGFKTADKIASKMGIEKNSGFRLRAGLIYTIKQVAETKGSTVVFKDELMSSTKLLLELDSAEDLLESAIISLIISGTIKQIEYEEQDAYAINMYYSMEKYIASKLKILNDNLVDINIDFNREIEDYQISSSIKLHENQIKAIKASISSGVCVITGGPGTGKTTIVKGVLKILKHAGLKCMLMAPTGRASKRLSEQTGEDASTIHRALEMQGRGDGMFLRNERNMLECDAVICDEVSMIDDFVMSSLLKAIPAGARLILVGDKDQLPSVGAGNVLADIIASKKIDVVELTQIFRQSDDSSIITNSHKINDGIMPNLTEKSSDFFYSSTSEPNAVLNEIVSMVTTRIPKFSGIDPSEIQVIAPMKAGIAGVDNINAKLQEELNAKSELKNELVHGKRVFREGDKVMQIKNNYDQEWIKVENNVITHGNGVFNGDIGTIEQINTQMQTMIVNFEDGRRTTFSIVDFENLTHAYAITIHKSQGSEFSVVIIPIMGGNPMLYNKNLLYTAVTRAKKMVVLIGKQSSIFACVKNNYVVKRYTMLKNFLENELDFNL